MGFDNHGAKKALRKSSIFMAFAFTLVIAVVFLSSLSKFFANCLAYLSLLFYLFSHLFLGVAASRLRLSWFKYAFMPLFNPVWGALISYMNLSVEYRRSEGEIIPQYNKKLSALVCFWILIGIPSLLGFLVICHELYKILN